MKWISAECPECDNEWTVTEEQVKGVIMCPECKESFNGPSMSEHGFIYHNNDAPIHPKVQ